MVGPATASAFPSRPLPTLLAVPCAHLQIEVLRRPLEFAQYTSLRYTAWFGAAGAAPSVGSVADSYDNAMAESLNATYKEELINRQSWQRIAEVEQATARWVGWYNHDRLHQPRRYPAPGVRGHLLR